jgi:O-antigen/teichoic acid export membrane protein
MFERLARFANAEGMAGPAFIMLIATVVGGGCNFLFQVTLAGYKPFSDEMAELNTLLALLYIVAVPATAVQNMLIRYVSKYHALNRDDVISWLMRRTLVLTVVAGVIFSILLIVFLNIHEVRTTLKLTTTLPTLLLAIGVFIALVSPIGQGPLQGLQRFTSFGLLSVGNFILKLSLGVGLVFLGYGVSGAIGGAVIGLAFSAGLSFILVRKYLLKPGNAVESKEIWWFALPAMIGVLCFTILTNVDVIFASILLPKDQANIYAPASMLAKIILFLPGAVSSVMFPKMAKAHAEKSETAHILKTAFGMTLFLSGLVALAYVFFPDLIVSVLIPGNIYRDFIPELLPPLGIAMVFLGLANLFMLYGLATDGHAYIVIMGLSVLVLVALVGGVVAVGIIFTPMILSLIMVATGLFIVIMSAIYLVIIERDWRPRSKRTN